jgi:hypothetical protein
MGLILVFDMDQTILDSSNPELFDKPYSPQGHLYLKKIIKEGLNWNIVNILKRAAKLRPSGKVTAICLLTNNSNATLVSAVDEVLYDETASKGKYKSYSTNVNDKTMPDKPYFFDSIMMRQHSSRPKTIDNNPPKRLVDILHMLAFLGISDPGAEAMKDIYFFDDIGSHALRAEFNFMSSGKYKDHYIQITPPYRTGINDTTDYNPILHSLANLDKEQPTLPPIEKPLRSGPVITKFTIPKQYPTVEPYQPTGKYPTISKYPTVEPYNAQPPPLKRAQSFQTVGPSVYKPSNVRLPQEQTIHKKPTVPRASLMNAFKPPSSAATGGSRTRASRKTRARHGRRRLTRRRK